MSESIPIHTVTPEQLAQAKAAAATLDLAAIEKRHAEEEELRRRVEEREGPGVNADVAACQQAETHADRGVLLVELQRLREQETVRVCRMIGVPREGVVRAWLDEAGRACVVPRAYAQSITINIGFAPVGGDDDARALGSQVEEAVRQRLAADPPNLAPRVTVDRSRPLEEGVRFTVEDPGGTLASIPPDACDGEPRPGER